MAKNKPQPKRKLAGYKLCKECRQPMLKRGQKREHPDDYRHANGCPLDDDERIGRRLIEKPHLQ